MIAVVSRLDAVDRERGRALSLAANDDTLFYHGGGCLLDNELDGLGRLVVGEIQSGCGVVALPSGWYSARDLWPHLFPRQSVRQARSHMGHVAAVANDQLGRQLDGKPHQRFAHRHFGDQLGLCGRFHQRLVSLTARLKALFRGSVE